MKKIILAFGLIICCAAMSRLAANPAVHDAIAYISNAAFRWTSTTFDFGEIKANVPVTHQFTFTNSGEDPLVIVSVQASCGCTVAEYSKAPIEPGQTGFVKATYNAAKVGAFNKTVTVNANTPDGTVQLSIKGTVVEGSVAN
jgi:hypothetical protein